MSDPFETVADELLAMLHKLEVDLIDVPVEDEAVELRREHTAKFLRERFELKSRSSGTGQDGLTVSRDASPREDAS